MGDAVLEGVRLGVPLLDGVWLLDGVLDGV